MWDFYKDFDKENTWAGGGIWQEYLGLAYNIDDEAGADNDVGDYEFFFGDTQEYLGVDYLSDVGLFNFSTVFNIGGNLSWIHPILDMNGNEVLGNFYTKDLQPIIATTAAESPLTGDETLSAWNSGGIVDGFIGATGDAPLIKIYKKEK